MFGSQCNLTYTNCMLAKLLKILLSIVAITAVTACAPTPVVFNVPEKTWNCLTTAEQQQAIEDYNQEKINDPNKCCLHEDPLKRCRCKA